MNHELLNVNQQISNLEAQKTLPIFISNKLDVVNNLIKATFEINNVANNTINSNYELSKEQEKYVIKLNNQHEQKTYHAENIKIFNTSNDEILHSLLDNFQHNYVNKNLMQRLSILRIMDNSPSPLPNVTMCGLLYADIAQSAARIKDFFQRSLGNSYIKAYISKKYGEDIKISILSIISTDNLLKGIVSCLLLRYKLSSCECLIISNLTTYAKEIKICSSPRCIVKWMNSSIKAVNALHILTSNPNYDWPDWKKLVYKFMASVYYCPFDMQWDKLTQSNTTTDNAEFDIDIDEARLQLLTIADGDKDLQNFS